MKILHTADVHLGLQFRKHPEASGTLAEARYKCLEQLVQRGNDEAADLFTVAGDLFERTSMNKKDVQRAVRALNRFEGVVLVLPGNHDYVTSESQLWNDFREGANDHVLVLHEEASVDLEPYGSKAEVYPGPCASKHSSENAIGWVKELEKHEEKFLIGMAHGSIDGITPDFNGNYFPMNEKELKESGLDIWLLGHTHIPYPEKPEKNAPVLNPGTPEPDGFDCSHEGKAFWIEADPSNKEWEVEPMSTGNCLFRELHRSIQGEKDLEKLHESIKEGERASDTVLKLSVEGRLDPELEEEWSKRIAEIREEVLELKLDRSQLHSKVTQADIEKEFPEGSFPERFLKDLIEEGDEAGLQKAYELIQNARS